MTLCNAIVQMKNAFTHAPIPRVCVGPQIIKILPKERQTMLFSATQTTKVRRGGPLQWRDIPSANALGRWRR